MTVRTFVIWRLYCMDRHLEQTCKIHRQLHPNQSIKQLVNWSVSQKSVQSSKQATNQSINQRINQSISQSYVTQWNNKSIEKLIYKLINQSTNRLFLHVTPRTVKWVNNSTWAPRAPRSPGRPIFPVSPWWSKHMPRSTLSPPIVINFKFLLQPHKKYYVTQYEELGFS